MTSWSSWPESNSSWTWPSSGAFNSVTQTSEKLWEQLKHAGVFTGSKTAEGVLACRCGHVCTLCSLQKRKKPVWGFRVNQVGVIFLFVCVYCQSGVLATVHQVFLYLKDFRSYFAWPRNPMLQKSLHIQIRVRTFPRVSQCFFLKNECVILSSCVLRALSTRVS